MSPAKRPLPRRTVPHVLSDALRRSETLAELEAAWADLKGVYPEDRPEYVRLLGVYHQVKQRLESAADIGKLVRV